MIEESEFDEMEKEIAALRADAEAVQIKNANRSEFAIEIAYSLIRISRMEERLAWLKKAHALLREIETKEKKAKKKKAKTRT